MKSKLLSGVSDREEEASIAIDADSILYSVCYLHRDNWNIELAYMSFMERIGTIRTECYSKTMKLNELLIVFTSKTNFRYDIHPEYKANRSKELKEDATDKQKKVYEDSELLVARTKEVKKLVYKRVKDIVKVSSVWEADDIVIQYAYKGYMVAAIDKDVVNACPTSCFNYKTAEWSNGHSKEDINTWYLIQSISGDASDNIKGVKGMGEVKATEFVHHLNNGKKTYEDYIDLFETPEHCLLMNQLVRMCQYDKSTGKLKLITMRELISTINPF